MKQAMQSVLVVVNIVKPWETQEKQRTGKTPRCSAPGCGDKIKDDECLELVFEDGTTRYLERDCLGWYVNGHPDTGSGAGLLPIAHSSFFKKTGHDNAHDALRDELKERTVNTSGPQTKESMRVRADAFIADMARVFKDSAAIQQLEYVLRWFWRTDNTSKETTHAPDDS